MFNKIMFTADLSNISIATTYHLFHYVFRNRNLPVEILEIQTGMTVFLKRYVIIHPYFYFVMGQVLSSYNIYVIDGTLSKLK